jgi:hypothetical protein
VCLSKADGGVKTPILTLTEDVTSIGNVRYRHLVHVGFLQSILLYAWTGSRLR